MNIYKLFVVLIMILITPINSSASKYTINQKKLMKLAYDEGIKIGYPNTMRAILLQETKAGLLGKYHDNGTSFGVMCVQLPTAKDMLGGVMYNNEFLTNKLMNDDVFNIKIATKYFNYLIEYFNGDWDKAVLSYNVGMGRVKKHGFKFDPNNYLSSIKKMITNNSGFSALCMNNKAPIKSILF